MNKIRVTDVSNLLRFLKQKNTSFLRMTLKNLRGQDEQSEGKSRQELLQLIRDSIQNSKKNSSKPRQRIGYKQQGTGYNINNLNKIFKFQEKMLEDYVKSSVIRQKKIQEKQSKYERTIIELGESEEKNTFSQEKMKEIQIGLQKEESYQENRSTEDTKIKKYLIQRKKKKISLYILDDLQRTQKKKHSLLKINLLELGVQSELIYPLRLIDTKWQNSRSASIKVLEKSDIKTTNKYLKDSLPPQLKSGIFSLPYKNLSEILTVMNTIKYWHYCSQKRNIPQMIQEIIKLNGREKQIVQLWDQLDKYTKFCFEELNKIAPSQSYQYAKNIVGILQSRFYDKESQNLSIQISTKCLYIGFKLLLTNLISKEYYNRVPQSDRRQYLKQVEKLILRYLNCFFNINQTKNYSYISEIESMLKSFNIVYTLLSDLKKEYQIDLTGVLKSQQYFTLAKDMLYGLQTIFQLNDDTKTIASSPMANSFIQNLALFVRRQDEYFNEKVSLYCFSLAHSHLRTLSPKSVKNLIKMLQDPEIIEKNKNVHDIVMDILKLGIGLDGKQTAIAIKALFKLRVENEIKEAVAQKLIQANISGEEDREQIQTIKSIIQHSIQNQQKRHYILQYLNQCQTPLPHFV